MWTTLGELPVWALVLLALLSIITAGGGTKAILDLVRWAVERRDRAQGPTGITSVFATVSRINTHLRTLKHDTCADRALLLRASNGGSIPRPGSRLFSSVVYEIVKPGVPPLADTWQSQELDAPYVAMLVEIDTRGYVYLRTEDMVESTLRTAYEANGVVAACVFDANGDRDSKTSYFYGSLTWTNVDDLPSTSILANEVRVARTAIARELVAHPE